jgi:hypothetical protein
MCLQQQKSGKQTIGSHIYKDAAGIMTQGVIYERLGSSLLNSFNGRVRDVRKE